MKTLLLKIFSLSTLLEYVARLALGAKLWEIIREAVNDVEDMSPDLPGEEKFKAALGQIKKAAALYGIAIATSLINWGIETAVRLLKEKLKISH